jgi:hypothetical protein
VREVIGYYYHRRVREVSGGVNAEIPRVEFVSVPAHRTVPKTLFEAAKGRDIRSARLTARNVGEIGWNYTLGARRNYGNKGSDDAAEGKAAGVFDGVGLRDDSQGE